MSEIFLSVVGGIFFISVFFVFSVVVVLGAKVFYKNVSSLFPKPDEKEVKPVKRKARKKPSNVVRSIEINPEEIDKIYVRKSS